MAFVSAAEYAASQGAKAAESKAMTYQANNPSTSSYMAYTPSSSSNSSSSSSSGATYKQNVGIPAATPPQNNNNGYQFTGVTPAVYNPSYNYQSTPTTQGLADPAKVGATPQLVTPTNTGQSTATGLYDPRAYSGNGSGGVASSVMGDGGAKTDTVIKDDRGVVIGVQLAGGGFMPLNGGGGYGGGSQMQVTPTGGSMIGGNNYGMGGFEQGQFNTPQQTGGNSASSVFNTKTPAQITAEAKARTDALLAKQTTLANSTKAGFQTSYDRLASTIRDDRTLADASFQLNNDPFSGSTAYKKDITGREREKSDRQAQQDLQTRLAGVDLSLADYANATDAQRMQMETDMTNQERAYGLQVDQFNLQRQGQNFNQGIAQAGVTGRYNGQNTMQMNQNIFNNGIAYSGLTGYMPNGQRTLAGQGQDQTQLNADRTYNAGRQDAATAGTGYYNPSGMNANEINQEIAKNSAAYSKASPEQKQQLHQRNIYLNGLLGKTDSTGNGDYVGGNPNGQVGYRTPQGQQLDFSQSLAIRELQFKEGSYWNTFNETARQFDVTTAIDKAYKDGQLTQQQYNGVTQRLGVNKTSVSEGIATQKYKDEQGARQLESEVYAHSNEFKSAQDVNDYFKANGAYLASKLGAADLDKLQKSFLAPFNADTKTDNSVYDKALAAAQKDPTWLLPSTDKKALIKDYQDLISSGQNSGNH